MKGYLDRLRRQGFDESWHVPFTRQYRVICSQCQALCINGIPCHETGCLQIRRDDKDD